MSTDEDIGVNAVAFGYYENDGFYANMFDIFELLEEFHE